MKHLRNACTEVTANNHNAADGGDDSDVCNLGSLNFARIADVSQLRNVVELATKFLNLRYVKSATALR